MKILMWHVHGSYTTSIIQGNHTWYIPTVPDRGPDGRGRATTYPWPDNAIEVSPEQMRDLDLDLVILQRPHELEHLAQDWLGRRPGRDIPAIYLEHNSPQGRINEMRHPVADRDDITVVHCTHFNRLFWDCGRAPTRVIEHGIVDPGYQYTGELPRVAVVINEPERRGRVTGTDLLAPVGTRLGVDLFGIGAGRMGGIEDLPQARLHGEMARRRVYFHPVRWTSLGLSLLEAMHLGMPIVALATTEVAEAVPDDAGVVTNRLDVLTEALHDLVESPETARRMGQRARAAALERYNLKRFLADWDALYEEVTRR